MTTHATDCPKLVRNGDCTCGGRFRAPVKTRMVFLDAVDTGGDLLDRISWAMDNREGRAEEMRRTMAEAIGDRGSVALLESSLHLSKEPFMGGSLPVVKIQAVLEVTEA